MARIRLTQRRVDALAPRRAVNDVRDTQLKGYGVRVMPSGAKRYFIHSQHRGRRVWKTVADAETVTETEARARARSMLTALRDGGEPDAEDPGEVLFEKVAEEVFARYGRRWNTPWGSGKHRPRSDGGLHGIGLSTAFWRNNSCPPSVLSGWIGSVARLWSDGSTSTAGQHPKARTRRSSCFVRS